MNYIVYDLEFNQKHLDSTEVQANKSSNLPFEIIQIGALKLNENFEPVYEDFLKFIDNDEIILCVWGTSDIKELLRNIKFHNLSLHQFLNTTLMFKNMLQNILEELNSLKKKLIL